jgi:large subunit ribosomal protein L16
MLLPNKIKFKNKQKMKLKEFLMKTNYINRKRINFGFYGLKIINTGYISSKEIEASRRIITRNTNRQGKLWINIFPDIPYVKKAKNSRMGKGKGKFSF